MTESECPQTAELLCQMHPVRRRPPTVHHQRLRNLIGPPQPRRAVCSCGWDGPERPDEQWADADWFGHEVEYETAALNEMAPEREVTGHHVPARAVAVDVAGIAGTPLEFEIVSLDVEFQRTRAYDEERFGAPPADVLLPRSLSEISLEMTAPLRPAAAAGFLSAFIEPVPRSTLDVTWPDPQPCPACGEPATGFHAVVDHTRQTSLDLDGFAGMEITMRAVRFEPCGCPQDRAVVERPGAYHVGVGAARRVEDCGTECQAPAEAGTVQAVRFDTVSSLSARGTTC